MERGPELDEAAAWLLRVRKAPGDAAVQAGLEAWLSRDRKHAAAWRTAQRAWVMAGAVGPAAPRPATAATPPRPRIRPWRVAAWSTVAALAACLLLLLLPIIQLHMRADHLTATGETRSVALDDGSRVTLDSASALAVSYTAGRRLVSLLGGQAYFEVAPDLDRPFSVQAGDLAVTVTGTAFDVRLTPSEASVAVAEGDVKVTYSRRSQPTETLLAPGQRLRVARPGGAPTLARVPLQSVASWRRGRLLIESATIAQLVEELRRYRLGAILVSDSALAARRVTGVFDLADPVRALRTIVEPHAGRVREITPWLLIVSGG